jgi:phytoene desaturase
MNAPWPAHPATAAWRRRAPHAVVIGSGFGGLAAAVRLGARGYRVTVLERLAVPGGRARVLRRDGFVFDAGPTIVTAPFLFEELWALAGRSFRQEIDLQPLAPFYRLRFDDGSVLDVDGDDAHMRAQVERLAPRDAAGFDRFMRLAAEIYRVGFERLGHVPFERFTDMLRIAPDLLRLRGWRSLHALVASHVRDERLRFALSFHPLFIGGDPFRVTALYGLIAHLERRFGVHWARGGTGRLVAGLVDLIEGLGGAIRYGADVREIAVEEGVARGVVLGSGERIAADVVISNADSASTYRELVPPRWRRRWTDRRLAHAEYSMGVFLWYFGTTRRYEAVPHHTIVLGPRYRGLLQDIFERKVLAPDFSLYLHRPTATEAALAPPGCDAFYALVPVPHLGAGIDWRTQAEPLRQAVQARLDATVLPGLSRHIATSFVLTPQDFHDELRAYRGAAFGLAPVLTQTAWFRPHNRSEDVRNLFLVGAGTHPGAGVPGVLSSARVLDRLLPHAAHFRGS